MSQLQYVILRHEGIPSPHFDLMFETELGGALITYRSAVWPLENRTELQKLNDHRRAYLTFEGPLSGNRGTVRRVVRGAFRWIDRPTRLRFEDERLGEWIFEESPDGKSLAIRA